MQHILRSMDSTTGRCAILFPHGVLFRDAEADLRRKLIEADLVECVLGLGPNLFFNSAMEACVVFCRSQKPADRKGRILFIDAANDIARERSVSFLKPEHQRRIRTAYEAFADEIGFARVMTLNGMAAEGHSLSIPLYVNRRAIEAAEDQGERTLVEIWTEWEQEGRSFWQKTDAFVDTLDELVSEEIDRG